MIAEAEVDQQGRIVLSDEVREAHRLVPGTRLKLDSQTGYIYIQTKPPGLYWENGVPVYYTGHPVPPESVDWVRQNREEGQGNVTGG